jgi:hypothetical protein
MRRVHPVAQEAGCQALGLEELLAASDAVVIATPTPTHARLATLALETGCTSGREAGHRHAREADTLISLAAGAAWC